jgi:hypothetical protein
MTDSDPTNSEPVDPNTEEGYEGPEAFTSELPDEGTEAPVRIRAQSSDRDAHGGSKTRKDGKTESFFGYEEHTIVRAPHGSGDPDIEPRLIARLEITPASVDIVDVTLDLLDRLTTPPEVLSADRHYHYKKTERWRQPLADRGIQPVHDLRVDEHGFTDFADMRWAAGTPHCPATPDALGTILRPAPNAPKAEHQAFAAAIERREQFAFRRNKTPDVNGKAQWECPAVSGKLGCPLRQFTVEAAMTNGAEIVENPPEPDDDSFKCCTQRTVQVTPPAPIRKLMQHHYWGSEEWCQEWRKRTYVEGSYGNRKNPSTENVRRGHIRVMGLLMTNLLMAMAAASYNLRMLRNWQERTGLGDSSHPLLQSENGPTRFTFLDDAALEQLIESHLAANDVEL